MFKMTRYIKIYVKFPSNIEAFWDDNHYIMYVDPHTRGKYQAWQNMEARGKYYPKGKENNIIILLKPFHRNQHIDVYRGWRILGYCSNKV